MISSRVCGANTKERFTEWPLESLCYQSRKKLFPAVRAIFAAIRLRVDGGLDKTDQTYRENYKVTNSSE